MLGLRGLAFVCIACAARVGLSQPAQRLEISASQTSLGILLDPQRGTYEVQNNDRYWRFAGNLGSAAGHARIRIGRDAIGPYSEIDFEWNPGSPMRGVIRSYNELPAVWFRAQYAKAVKGNGVEFPKFDTVPSGFNFFSFQDRTFSPPTYGLAKTATPWLLFDDRARSMVISPASNFMVATMEGDGVGEIGVGMGEKLAETPSGLNQDCLMVLADGIGAAWDRWGSAMQTLYHKTPPANDADKVLKFFGYWTDNGADYYYNYDPGKGYAGTMLEVANRYREEGIPIKYLQLDSWWYQKSINDAAGRAGPAKKNKNLPEGTWNRYGGTVEYRANPDLFTSGLAKFQHALGLPLTVHGRWIDRSSPYHERFKISGVGAIDPNWWKDTVAYLKSCGVVMYEQDWLDEIYLNSPEMAAKVGVGDAFTDAMADACNRSNMSMQYCMGTPRFFLQGLRYPNLTTIRTSGDRFDPGKWANFLYVSRLADEVGVWPWCDVFKSGELGNMTVATLSAGPIGTGDALGKESKDNIMKAARADGVIVKPDKPLMLIDRSYLDGAAKKKTPFVASTYTDLGGYKTTYAFIFPRGENGDKAVNFNLRELGVTQPCYVYDLVDRGPGQRRNPNDGMNVSIGADGYVYLEIVPVSASGIVLFGDVGKLVPMGRQRIEAIDNKADGLHVRVRFAKGDETVTLEGSYRKAPTAQAVHGTVSAPQFDAKTKLFVVDVTCPAGGGVVDVVLKG